MMIHRVVPRFPGFACATVLLLAVPLCGQAQTDLERIRISADIANRLPGDGAIAVGSDHTVSEFSFDDGFAEGVNPLGELPGADIDAYHVGDGCCASLYSVDATTEVAGSVVRPADVFDASGNVVLEGAAAGIPAGINIDALSRDPASCRLVLSIDVTAELGGETFRPGDLVEWDSASGFGLYLGDDFDIDIDALHLLDNGRLLISVAIGVQFPDIFAHDDEVIEIVPDGPGSPQFLSFSPRMLDESWEPADLDALWALRRALPGTVRWAQSEVSVFEDAGTISLSVERVGGAEGSIDVQWAASDGTAQDGIDFLGGSGTLSLADGATGGGVVVTLVDDALTEGDETFTVSITGVSNGTTVGSPSTVTVLIVDDEDFLFADGFESP